MTQIHPTAVVSREAEIAEGVEIGPHVVIEGPVRVGAGTRIIAQAYITGHTEVGPECVIHPLAAIGGPPQDRAHKGERSYCRLGARVIVREFVSIHCGTGPESVTTIGPDCMLMANAHVAHNCALGAHVTLINGAMLGGHVQIGERAVLGGNAAVHQFVRIGEYAMIGGLARITQDAAPFLCYVERNQCVGINRVGLRRAGFSSEAIDELRMLHRRLFRAGDVLGHAAEQLHDLVRTDAGRRLIAFVQATSRRGIGGRRATGPIHAERRHEDEDVQTLPGACAGS